MVGLRRFEKIVVLCCLCGLSGAHRADDSEDDGILDTARGDFKSPVLFGSIRERDEDSDPAEAARWQDPQPKKLYTLPRVVGFQEQAKAWLAQKNRKKNWAAIVSNLTQEVERLSSLSAEDQLHTFTIWERTLPKEKHTAEMFKWLSQRLVHTEGLTTAGQGCIANLMADFNVLEHIKFLETEPDHYAAFYEAAHFCASSWSMETGAAALAGLLSNFFDMVKDVPGSLATRYPRMPLDTAEVWALYEEKLKSNTYGAYSSKVPRPKGIQALSHVISRLEYTGIEDALYWYANLVHSLPLQDVEKDLFNVFLHYLVSHEPDQRNLSLQLRRADVFYTKLPLPSFHALLGAVLQNSRQQLHAVVDEILENLVRRIEARSSLDVMTSAEIAELRECAQVFRGGTRTTHVVLRACDIRNRTQAFALTAELGVFCTSVLELLPATESASMAFSLLDMAGQSGDQFYGMPASVLVSNAWRFFKKQGADTNKNILMQHPDIVQKILHPSTFEYLRSAYSGLLDNMCNSMPTSLVGIAPEVFLPLLKNMGSVHNAKHVGDFEGVKCMTRLAALAPCQLLEADPTIPKQLLTIMRGEVNDSCVDTPDWQDAKGYLCFAWGGYTFSCKKQALHEGYTFEQAEDIESNCKGTCKTCVTAAFDKFSRDQAGLGAAFKMLTTCESDKDLLDEFGLLRSIVADAKSLGIAIVPVVEAIVNIVKRHPRRLLKTDVMDNLYFLLRQRWPEAVSPKNVTQSVLHALSELVKAAGAVSHDLEVKNAKLHDLTNAMTSKNSELKDLANAMKSKNSQLNKLADSLSNEKEELRNVYQSQTEQRRSDERIVNLSRHFSGIAHRQVPCKDASCIIPNGWMVKSLNDFHDLDRDDMDAFVGQNQLFRCPNQEACFGDRAWAARPSSQKSERMCAVGYRESSLGCAQCEDDHGRSQFDPFLCRKCVPLSIASAQHVLPQLVIYVAGTAFANAPPTPAGSLMNVLLSFSLTAHCVLTPLASTRIYKEVKTNFSNFVMQLAELPQAGAESAGFGYISYDCMQRQLSLSEDREEESGFIWIWLAFDACVPAALLLLSFVINYIIRIFKPEVSLTRVLVLPVVVFGNAFIPKLFGAALRSYPCIHEIHARQRVMSYALNMQCSLLNTLPMAAACGLVCCCLGPVFWAIMFLRSHVWTEAEKKETLNYLAADYQPAFQWWETLVLLRKMSLAAVNTLWPASYAPSSYCLFCNIVVGTALMLHCWCCPYTSAFLNRVEIGALFSASLAMAGAQYVTVDDDWTHEEADSFVLLIITFVILTLTFVILVGLWIYTLLVDFGLLRGYDSKTGKEPEDEPANEQEDSD